MKRTLTILAAALPLSAAQAQEARLVTFVTCPVYRDADSGKKSGCWLAENPETGQRWDVSLSPYKPDWNYAVLVEGRVSDAGPEACGAPVLDAVRTSRLYDMPCPAHMLPAEGFAGRKFVLPDRHIDPIAVPRETPDGPFGERTFTLFYEFDQSFLVYQYDDYLMDRAATWIAATEPREVIVTGYAATDPIDVTGLTIAEKAEVAKERAEGVATTLRRLMPELTVRTRTALGSEPVDDADADGLPGQSQRRAEIRVVF